MMALLKRALDGGMISTIVIDGAEVGIMGLSSWADAKKKLGLFLRGSPR
jgi:hypothetical protein